MTNEEVIKQLIFLKRVDFHVDTKEACDLAIKAIQEKEKLKAAVNKTIGNLEELEEKIIKIYNEADYDLENEKDIELDEMEY